MSVTTYFVQGCPTCGRKLQIRVAYLGRNVVCQHCQGRFIATDPSSTPDIDPTESAILRRADQLLETASMRQQAQAARTAH
ncbi:MAG TPA: response regulator [Pirellulales bacterium]|jgi:DNA-directed RNA polymerase subunit RPC12/RpoP|nr:response regulator [Pirellulales bacterium]